MRRGQIRPATSAAKDAAYAEAMMPVAIKAVENLQALLAAHTED